MKQNIIQKYSGLCLAALFLGGAGTGLAQTADLPIATYDAGEQGAGINWGTMTKSWDSVEGNPAGSLLCNAILGGGDTPFAPYQCIGGGNPWWNNGTADFALYQSVEFDIKWDPTSDVTIDQFNNLSTWDTTMTNKNGTFIMQSWAGSGYLAGSVQGISVNVCGPGPVQVGTLLTNMPIPAAAATGWAHISIPIDPTKSGLAGMSGITIMKWINQNWGIANPARCSFWIDNIVLKGTAGPPPPPTVKVPTKATKGLNVFATTKGNSFYDRQSAMLRQGTGLSWVGQATIANPVTYSFTIIDYPQSSDCAAYMFLVPNPSGTANAPDWNETNCVVVSLQGNSGTATMRFRYKVNETSQQAMYSGGNEPRGYYTNAPGSWDGITPNYLESGDLGFVTNSGVLGTWTVKFTSDTNVSLIAPNGNTSSFIFPAYNAPIFAEGPSQPVGFNIYLGMQANQANAMNQAVVYSQFAVTGTASPYSENFLAGNPLDTTNTWNTSVAGGPKGVLIVPDNSSSWVSWTLPDTSFSLQASPNLTSWTDPATGPVIPMDALRSQLVASNEIPVGSAAFYRLIKREFTQLQVLFPGETNAPNTLTGKVGAPDPVTAGAFVNVTINAVDATYHLITSGTGSINLTSTDGAGIMPLDAPLVGGTLVQTIQLNTPGSWTVTATNTASATIPAATSSSITVN